MWLQALEHIHFADSLRYTTSFREDRHKLYPRVSDSRCCTTDNFIFCGLAIATSHNMQYKFPLEFSFYHTSALWIRGCSVPE